MAHWAEIDNNNRVLRVIVCDDNLPDDGYQWLIDNLSGTWIKTSYNGEFRKNYAGVGYLYDPILDAFISPTPFESWILNEETCQWEAPKEKPNGNYYWNEEQGDWLEIVNGS